MIVTAPEISRQLETETGPTIWRSKAHVVTPVGHTWRLLNYIVSQTLLSDALTAGYGGKDASPDVLEDEYVTASR